MSRTVKILLLSASVLVLLLCIIYWVGHIASVQDALTSRIAHERLGSTQTSLLDRNRMSVVLCGTGSPAPDRDRASACTAVFAGGELFLVDVGPGSARKVGAFGLPVVSLSAVLLTHFHSDHIGDLGEINTQSWIVGRNHPLAVFGPPGVEEVVDGFMQAYALDRGYRTAVVPLLQPQAWEMEPHVIMIPGSHPGTSAPASTIVLDRRGLRITAFTVDHAPVVPAYGFRFDYRGRSVVISGDTAKSANLIRVAQHADLLIHEAQSKHIISILEQVAADQHNDLLANTFAGIQRYHSSPMDAAETANDSHVKLLVLSHLTPPQLNFTGRWVFMRGVSAIRPHGVQVGYDGMTITLPIGSAEIYTSGLD